MNTNEISYALSKQLQSIISLNTNYGTILLDNELQEAIQDALRPILERRLSESN